MKITIRHLSSCGGVKLLLMLAGLLLATLPTMVAAEDDGLEGLLQDVGEEYARAYAAPLLYSFGPNLNSGLYSTAAIPWGDRLTISVALKVTATHLNADDQTFSKVISDVDLGDFDDAYAGTTGDIVISGPTVFGDPDEFGTIAGYVSGLQVFSQEGIEGLVDTRFSPLPAPEVTVGGIKGLRATLRFFPSMNIGDLGKIGYRGFGLQWSPNGLLTNFPVDVMAGFFTQSLDIDDVVDANASSIFLAVSKSFTAVTVYGGLAKESSDMTIKYSYIADETFPDDVESVTFEVDDAQESRITLGATLDFLAKLNLEMGHGDVTTYTAGLLFGF